MSLTIAQVVAKATEEISYVHDAPFHYIVLTRKDNTWDTQRIARYIEVLDQIEASEGPGVLVTIGSGPKHFSSGFDLPFWIKKWSNWTESVFLFQQLMARLFEFPMPTMCVFNGAAIAGGYILGLCHDFRIMDANKGNICLSELKLGIPLPPAYMRVIAAKLPAIIANKISYGITVKQQDALKDTLIDDIFESPEQLQEKLAAFAKRYAGFGVHRVAIKANKINQFGDTIGVLRSTVHTPSQLLYFKAKHADMAVLLTKQFAAAKAAKAAAKQKPKPKL